jgi:hypothetical protein
VLRIRPYGRSTARRPGATLSHEPMRRATPEHPEDGAPALLLAFFLATVTMIGAVVAIGRTDSDWADAAAIALLLGLVALMGAMIRRVLRDR